MNFDFSEEQKELRAIARRLLSDESSPERVRAAYRGDSGYDPRLWARLGEMGFIGAAFPERHGGSGAGYLEACVIAEELGRALAPVPFLTSAGQAAELLIRAGSEDQLALNPPGLLEVTLNPNGNKPALFLQNGFPANTLNPADVSLSTLHIHAMQANSPTPSTQEWSIGFQRELPARMVLTMDYVGTKSSNLDIIRDLNQFVPGTTTFPYPNFGYLEYSEANGVGNYSGLETSVQRRFNAGLSFEAAYTWSKNTGTTYEQTSSNALSGSDIPQRVVLSYLYELPFGHNKAFLHSGPAGVLLGGWRTSGGNFSNDIDIYGNATSLPNVVGPQKIVGNVNCWFYTSLNKSCPALSPNTTDPYVLPTTANPYGNGGINNLRGPHTNVFDFALMRDFDLHERTNLQFRWEVFNLTNSVLFAQPDSGLLDNSVGTITSLAGDPRIMQFALRLSF